MLNEYEPIELTRTNYIKYRMALAIHKMEQWVKRKKKERINQLGGMSMDLDFSNIDMFKSPHQMYIKLYEISRDGSSNTFPDDK